MGLCICGHPEEQHFLKQHRHAECLHYDHEKLDFCSCEKYVPANEEAREKIVREALDRALDALDEVLIQVEGITDYKRIWIERQVTEACNKIASSINHLT